MDKVSELIFYKRKDGKILIFLQKRSQIVKFPGYYDLFGGHALENETPDETLIREMKEELNFEPKGYKLFQIRVPEDKHAVKHTYMLEVNDDFENKIKFNNETECGKWFDYEEFSSEPMTISDDKSLIQKFVKQLENETN